MTNLRQPCLQSVESFMPSGVVVALYRRIPLHLIGFDVAQGGQMITVADDKGADHRSKSCYSYTNLCATPIWHRPVHRAVVACDDNFAA
jgi:hypothetical protein